MATGFGRKISTLPPVCKQHQWRCHKGENVKGLEVTVPNPIVGKFPYQVHAHTTRNRRLLIVSFQDQDDALSFVAGLRSTLTGWNH